MLCALLVLQSTRRCSDTIVPHRHVVVVVYKNSRFGGHPYYQRPKLWLRAGLIQILVLIETTSDEFLTSLKSHSTSRVAPKALRGVYT